MRTTGYIYDETGRPAAAIHEDGTVWSDTDPPRRVGCVRGGNIYNLADELIGHLAALGEPDRAARADLTKLLG